MRKYARRFTVLALVVSVVASCAFLSLVLVGGMWLQTYHVLTQETLVAEVIISARQTDQHGEYANVVYQPVEDTSALAYIFSPQHTQNRGNSQDFKIYGDTLHIGGPMIKLHTGLLLFNFENIYKVGVIFGRYNLDPDLERSKAVNSSYDINGGIDETWRDLAVHINEFPRNLLFDTTQVSTPGVFIESRPVKYQLFITPTGFLWRKTN